jgi:hypothetical protein
VSPRDLFTGTFPGFKLSEAEADSLYYALDELPWWCDSAAHYPLPLRATQGICLSTLLLKVTAPDAWREWSYWDKFTIITISSAVCAPFFNCKDTAGSRGLSGIEHWNLEAGLSGLSQLISDDLTALVSPIPPSVTPNNNNLPRYSFGELIKRIDREEAANEQPAAKRQKIKMSPKKPYRPPTRTS